MQQNDSRDELVLSVGCVLAYASLLIAWLTGETSGEFRLLLAVLSVLTLLGYLLAVGFVKRFPSERRTGGGGSPARFPGKHVAPAPEIKGFRFTLRLEWGWKPIGAVAV